MSSGTQAIGPVMQPRAGASLLHLGLLGAVMLLGVLAWHALTRGLAPPIGRDGIMGALGAIWMVPAIYLAAWQVLSFTSLRRALAGAAILAGLSVATFFAALGLGLISFGLLALPAGAVGVVVIGRILAGWDAADAAPASGAGRAVHVGGLMIALAGLIPAVIGMSENLVGPVRHLRRDRVLGEIREADQVGRLAAQREDLGHQRRIVPLPGVRPLVRGARDPGLVELAAQRLALRVRQDRLVVRRVQREQPAGLTGGLGRLASPGKAAAGRPGRPATICPHDTGRGPGAAPVGRDRPRAP